MGYQPNRLAQALPTGRTRTLAVLVPDITNPHNFGRAGRGGAGARRGFHARDRRHAGGPGAGGGPPGPAGLLGRRLRARREPAARRRACRPSPSASRSCCSTAGSTGWPSLATDSADGSRQIVEHLVALGHRSLAYLAGPSATWSDARTMARPVRARRGGRRHDRPAAAPSRPRSRAVRPPPTSAWPTGATALIAFNDLLAIGVLRRLGERGIAVPGAGQRGRVRRHLRRRLLLAPRSRPSPARWTRPGARSSTCCWPAGQPGPRSRCPRSCASGPSPGRRRARPEE